MSLRVCRGNKERASRTAGLGSEFVESAPAYKIEGSLVMIPPAIFFMGDKVIGGDF